MWKTHNITNTKCLKAHSWSQFAALSQSQTHNVSSWSHHDAFQVPYRIGLDLQGLVAVLLPGAKVRHFHLSLLKAKVPHMELSKVLEGESSCYPEFYPTTFHSSNRPVTCIRVCVTTWLAALFLLHNILSNNEDNVPIKIFWATNCNQTISPSQFGKHANFVVSFKLSTHGHSPYPSNDCSCVHMISKQQYKTINRNCLDNHQIHNITQLFTGSINLEYIFLAENTYSIELHVLNILGIESIDWGK